MNSFRRVPFCYHVVVPHSVTRITWILFYRAFHPPLALFYFAMLNRELYCRVTQLQIYVRDPRTFSSYVCASFMLPRDVYENFSPSVCMCVCAWCTRNLNYFSYFSFSFTSFARFRFRMNSTNFLRFDRTRRGSMFEIFALEMHADDRRTETLLTRAFRDMERRANA